MRRKTLSALLVAAIMIAGLSACNRKSELIDCIKNTGETQACIVGFNAPIKACLAKGGTSEECRDGHATQFKRDKYVGEYSGDEANGQGTYTWANGDKYVGEFQHNKRHGHGTTTWANGDKYVGEYSNGKRHGQGTITKLDGYEYVGGFRVEQYHGQGTVTFPSGEKYAGRWRLGRPHGQGTYTFTDIGKVAEGVYDAGCLGDFCITTLPRVLQDEGGGLADF